MVEEQPQPAAASDAPTRTANKGKRVIPAASCWAGLPGPASDVAPKQPQAPAGASKTGSGPAPQSSTQTPGNVPASPSAGNKASGWQPGRSEEETPAKRADDRIKGLGDLPPDWPKLPANASLSAEIAWVQANRLSVVEVKANGSTVVHLEKARSPAPSWSALSWLETSIRSYAKWVEVAAKASGADDGDQVQAKREKARIEDIRAVLAEMLEERGG